MTRLPFRYLLVLWVLLPWPLGLPQSSWPAELEGPLDNDTFVATDAVLQAMIAEGDGLLVESRQGQQDPASIRSRGLDAWQAALVEATLGLTDQGAPHGIWVAGLDPEGRAAELLPARAGDLGRMYLSVFEAVQLRLESLAPEESDAWRARIGPLAEQALEQDPHQPEWLARIDRLYPSTEAAALACLRLADARLEEGAQVAAQSYLVRATRHLGKLGGASPWKEALAARAWRAPAEETAPAGRAGQALFAAGAWRLESRSGRLAPGEPTRLGLGPRPGLVTFGDGSIAVQTPQALYHLAVDTEGHPLRGMPQIEDLSLWTREGPIFPVTPPSSGGWPHLPVRLGQRLFLVVDRARPGSARLDLPIPPRSNHLLALDRVLGQPSQLAWQRNSSGLRQAAGTWNSEAEPIGHMEYQPGPLVVDETLWVLARSLASQAEEDAALPSEEFLWLLGFDTGNGELEQRVRLHKASDLAMRDETSLAHSFPTACQPLGLDRTTGQLLVQTNQGMFGLVEAADGRPRFLWVMRRRAPATEGWPGSYRPKVFAGQTWVTPMDSDRAYGIDLRPGIWPIVPSAVEAKDGRMALAAWDATGRTYLARRGARQTLWTEVPGREPILGLLLGPEEALVGMPAVTPTAVLFTGESGFYRLDRSRELALDLRIALEDRGAGIGGDVCCDRSRVWILGPDTLWLLLAP
ncbi:MAG: hypothetical protein H6827_05765 [Planctomycetes bacterium]|nr:hypothetical protein [Planctomycetota bacterium]